MLQCMYTQLQEMGTDTHEYSLSSAQSTGQSQQGTALWNGQENKQGIWGVGPTQDEGL